MRKIQGTYSDLSRRWNELQAFGIQYPTLMEMMENTARFQSVFKQNNDFYLNIIWGKEEKLQEEHVKMKDGAPVIIKTDQGLVDYDYKSEQDKQEFQRKWQEFLKQPCPIIV